MKYSTIALLTALISNGAYAADLEYWNCYADSVYTGDILLSAAYEKGTNKGVVLVAGKSYTDANYHVEGIERRWDFRVSDDMDHYLYALVVKPNGYTQYYDFTHLKSELESTQASMIMWCKKQ